MKTFTAKEMSSPSNAALLEEIVLLISHAFIEDAQLRWLFANHSRESLVASLPAYKRMIVRLSLECEALFTIITKDEAPPQLEVTGNSTNEPQIDISPDSTIRAVAIMIPPEGNANFSAFMPAVRAGGLTLPFKCGFRFAHRLFTEFLPELNSMHDRMFPDPDYKNHNWHLFYLAAHPNSRGQGLGKRLLNEVQRRVKEFNETKELEAKAEDRVFVPAPLYLEASNYVNKRLYSRVGFEERANMVAGKLENGEDIKIGENGKVIGVRCFGMVCQP